MLVANPDVIRWGLVGAGSVCEVRRTRLDDRQMSAGRRLLVCRNTHPVMGAASGRQHRVQRGRSRSNVRMVILPRAVR